MSPGGPEQHVATQMRSPRLGRIASAERDRRWRSYGRALGNVSTGPLALAFLAVLLWVALHSPSLGYDFRFAYWHAGHDVLTGHSPYNWSESQYRDGFAFVYPALSALLFAPLSWLPVGFGVVLLTFVCIALLPLTLWTLGVRDRRVYGIAPIWAPAVGGWVTANESLFLMLGLACVWRWRNRPLVAGLLTAAMVSLKPMMWPLALWLLVTRRWRASAYGLVSGVLINLTAWWLIGFGQIGAFLRASRISTDLQWQRGYGIPALLAHFGADRTLGLAVMVIAALVLVVAVAYTGLALRDEVLALTLMVALACVASPLIWGHYLVLILVPLALLRPRLDWVWVCPLLLWICAEQSWVPAWQAVGAWLICTAMFVALARTTAAPALLDRPGARW